MSSIGDQTLDLANVPFDQIICSISDGVVVIDREGKIIFVNPAYTRILGISAEEALGRNMQNVTPDAHTLKVLRTGKPLLHDTHYSRSKGIDVVMSANPIFHNGVMVGVVTIFRTAREMLDLYASYRRSHGLVDYYRDMLLKQDSLAGNFAGIVGDSGTLANVMAMAARVAETDATVLIGGENGVGKDIFAQAIHDVSRRRDKQFVVVNSAAIPEALLESELFGYEQGAFTGATRGGKVGKFELAEGGTLFLDEIGDMTLAMQAKLLRVLQNKEIQKIGSNRTILVDARIIAATNRNLEQMVRERQFREDLFYRLNVFPITIPSLRERKGDVPRLAQYFLDQFCGVYRKSLAFAPEAFEALERCDWPGNVRQLRNAIERAVILCDGEVVLPDHFMSSFDFASTPSDDVPQVGLKGEVRKVERKAYEDALLSNDGNKTRAMEALGVSRRTFYKRLKEFGLL